MTVQTESVTNVFEQAFDGLRKTAEANLEMQQELFRQWSLYWPGIAPREDTWVERAQKFQKDWAKLVKDSLNRHREVLDEQYRLGLESLDEAFRVAQSTDPQEYAKRCTALCKKCLEVVRESGELQVKETQEAIDKWVALAVKSAG